MIDSLKFRVNVLEINKFESRALKNVIDVKK